MKPSVEVYPNIEGLVTEQGCQQLFFGGMRVVNGVFAGMELGKGVELPSDIFRVGKWLGNHYHSLGYRGYFDIDFVAGKDGAMYICESNTRRTGVTWAYYVAQVLLGGDFLRTHYIATQLVGLPNTPLSFESLLKRLQPLLFNPRTTEGVVFYSAQLLTQGKLGYMVIGKNKQRAYAIEEAMLNLLA
jgi:hypothetical protein